MPKKASQPEPDPRIAQLFSDKTNPDLDLVVLQSLVRLVPVMVSEFANYQWPPENIRQWLDSAGLPEVNGMLIATLRRWHELRHEEFGKTATAEEDAD